MKYVAFIVWCLCTLLLSIIIIPISIIIAHSLTTTDDVHWFTLGEKLLK